MTLYNEEIKNRYLDTLKNDETKDAYRHGLALASVTESIEGKDLYNFNLSQIADVIKNKQPFRLGLVHTRASVIRQYIDWAIENGYRDNSLNPLDSVTNDWYNSLVDTKRKMMFTEEEITEIINQTANFQDRATIRLIFEGAWGSALSELSNLRMEDVNNDTNEITLENSKGEKRTIKVSDTAIELIHEANEQRFYKPDNGEGKTVRHGYIERELREFGYVFKNTSDPRTADAGKVSPHTFYNRIISIKNYLGEEELSPTSIRKSGIMKLAHDLYLKNGKLDRHEVDVIGEQFGMRKIKNNGSEYHNKTAMREMISAETLMRYYGLNIEDKQVN